MCKNKEWIFCEECGKRFDKEEMIDLGYLRIEDDGRMYFECPKCEIDSLVK